MDDEEEEDEEDECKGTKQSIQSFTVVQSTYQSQAPHHWTHQDQQMVVDLIIFLHHKVKHLQKTEGGQSETKELKQRPQRLWGQSVD